MLGGGIALAYARHDGCGKRRTQRDRHGQYRERDGARHIRGLAVALKNEMGRDGMEWDEMGWDRVSGGGRGVVCCGVIDE